MDVRNRADRRRLLLAGAAGIATEWLGASRAQAQDPVQTQSKSFRVVLENENVRVLEFVSRPGQELCGVGKHSHPAHLTVALSDAKVRVTLPDGKRIIAGNKPGDVFWSEAETHSTENIGGNNIRALIVEIKSRAATKA
jgi:quercetin dioxygenase-like cupin family protein